MTIDDIEVMSAGVRARRLVGDMPWVTEHLTAEQLDDLPRQIETCLRAAILQERERCAQVAMDDLLGTPGGMYPAHMRLDNGQSEFTAKRIAAAIRFRGK